MSLERSPVPLSNQSQITLLPILARYCEENARDLKLIKAMDVGLCRGLAVLEGYARILQEEKKSELPLPRDDITWLTNVKMRLLTWKANQPFPRDPDNPFVQDIERFISNVISLGNYVYQPITSSSWNLELLLRDTKDRTLKSTGIFAAPVTPAELTNALGKMLPENTCMFIGAGKHATFLEFKNGKYLFVNSNYNEGEMKFENTSLSKYFLGVQIFLAHNKLNLWKSSQFIFDTYKLVKFDEEVKKEDRESWTPPTLFFNDSKTQWNHYTKPVEWVGIINEQAKNWGKSSILEHCLHSNTTLSFINYYLKNDAKLNIQDEQGFTPLHVILCYDHDRKLDVIKSLLKAGADILIPDGQGQSPLFIAMLFCADFYSNNPTINSDLLKAEELLNKNILLEFGVSSDVIEKIKLKENVVKITEISELLTSIPIYYSNLENVSLADKSEHAIFLMLMIREVHRNILTGNFEYTCEYLKKQIRERVRLAKSKENLLLISIENKLTCLTKLWVDDLKDSLLIKEEDLKRFPQFLALCRGFLKMASSYPESQRVIIKNVIKESIISFCKNPTEGVQTFLRYSHKKLWLPNSHGKTPFVWAARLGLTDFISSLLDRSNWIIDILDIIDPSNKVILFDINHRDDGQSALYFAVLREDRKLIDILLAHGVILPKDYVFNPLLQALRTKQFSIAEKLLPEHSFAGLKANFYHFKKLDNLAQRLIDAVRMYRASIYFVNSDRDSACDKILAAINRAYDTSLANDNYIEAYQQLLFGNSAEHEGILKIINQISDSHKNTGYYSLIFKQPKATKSRLEIELTNALTESDLLLSLDEKGYIKEVKSGIDTQLIDVLVVFKEKMLQLKLEHKLDDQSPISKICRVLQQYGYSSPQQTVEIIHDIAATAVKVHADIIELKDVMTYFYKAEEIYKKPIEQAEVKEDNSILDQKDKGLKIM